MKQKKSKTFQIRKKKKIYDHLAELVRNPDEKEKYKYHNRDDLDYYGIRDIYLMIIIIMIMITTNQYQSKVLLKEIINIMKAEVIKTKNYQ